jgi:nitrite reductase/ring-hydroxylating ferredoxin subunit
MTTPHDERHGLGDLSSLPEGEMMSCPAGKIDVLVCRVNGQLHALEDMCSHADTILSDGLLVGYTVTCSLHGAQFDVRDGSHKGPPAYTGVRTFELEDTDTDDVKVVIRQEVKADAEGPPDGYFQTR